ncbi:glycosyltransferase [Sphingobacterium siyangense]|uniref:glycosyltransferase n=1 Tax=Sphingobacterium siyangense TaxID=459529 RepID=UPI003DA4D3B0
MNIKKTHRVLFVLPNDNLGGAEQHLKNIAFNLASNGYKAEVYFLKKETSLQWRGLHKNINLHFTNRKRESIGVISFLITLFLTSRNKRKFDYIYTSHVHINSLVGILVFLGILKKKFFIGRESTSVFKRFKGLKLLMFKAFYKLGYSNLDLLICQTEYMRRQLFDALPKLISKINVQVIPNPINLDVIKNEILDCDLIKQNYIVSAGRLIPEKGFDILIKAFANLENRFYDHKLVILGEGSERRSLENLIKGLNLVDRVLLLGFNTNVYSYFKYARCCVVSSRIEGFPNVLLQMMSQNNSIISTLCAGGIEDIPSIYTCDPGSIEQLSYQINRALINDNSSVRETFTHFLKERSVSGFIEKVNSFLKVK